MWSSLIFVILDPVHFQLYVFNVDFDDGVSLPNCIDPYLDPYIINYVSIYRSMYLPVCFALAMDPWVWI